MFKKEEVIKILNRVPEDEREKSERESNDKEENSYQNKDGKVILSQFDLSERKIDENANENVPEKKKRRIERLRENRRKKS